MAQFSSLPPEILGNIFLHADQKSQKALRLTNRQLGAIGQQSVFQTLRVCPTEESYGRLENILKRPDLVPYINKIYLNTYDVKHPPESQYDDGEDVASRLFLYLKDMPRLQSVALRFHWECPDDVYDDVQQDENFRSEVMQTGLGALAALPGLKDLALRDIYNVNETDTETVASLNTILPRLRSLRLNVTNANRGMKGSSDYDLENPQRFFSELPLVWLKPALSNLQHLTLYSSIYAGFFPKCDFRDLHFPNLKSLAFGNHTFIHDSQLNWILSHAATLTELYMDDCAIVHEAAIYTDKQDSTLLPPDAFKPHPHLPDRKVYTSYSTRWADYFRAFKEKLVNLREFRYGHAPNWWADDTTPFESEHRIRIGFGDESYLVFFDGVLPSEYTDFIYWEVPREGLTGVESRREMFEYVDGVALRASDDDEAALRELCDCVGSSRRNALVDEDEDDLMDGFVAG
ncbi:uncharacterized protein DSM5745_09592 [Aspergillus mulundensis]|uniref:F-box domain-containing protein n=1 Tax=Aspergillus mulundensis TaxID=1810919 RepID=A0A3D8QVG5_9EURO|nr:Uncharacterized protein DSM5745_09592 [Aspergillus mulundensis]RDW65853.1 Uncharacterized protein DSM5745_09592 [Aspergillus mulundensis]